MKEEFWVWIKKYGVYLITAVLWWYFRRQDAPYTLEHSVDFYTGIFLGLLFLGRYIGNLGKYGSPHFTADNIHGSCSVKPLSVRAWTLFRLGGIKYPPLPYFRGSEATVIIRKGTWDMIGDNFITNARCKPVEKDQIPFYLMSYIEKKNYPTEKIYMGYASFDLEFEDPDFLEIEDELEEANSVIDSLKKGLRGKFDVAEGMIKGVERMGKSIKGKRRFKLFGRNEDDEKE